jgi:hypothetical protein
MLITLDWILLIVPGLTGAVMVAFGYPNQANAIWCVGNIFLITHNYYNGDMSQMWLFVIYEVFAIIGLIRWYYIRKKNTEESI